MAKLQIIATGQLDPDQIEVRRECAKRAAQVIAAAAPMIVTSCATEHG